MKSDPALYFGKKILIIAVLLLSPLLFPRQSQALSNPSQYYDWNNYSEKKVLGIEAFAQTADSDATAPAEITTPASPEDYHSYKQYDGYVLGIASDWTPENPFYFIKTFQEGVATTFTFDPQAKEELRMAIAGERIEEMEKMAEEGKTAQVESLANSYNDTMETIAQNLENLKNQDQEVTELLAKTDLEAAKHVVVLEEVSLKVPPEGEDGIKTAIEACEKTVDTVADLAGRPAVPPEVIDRLQALKAQGLLTEEEVNKLVNVESRLKAREEFRKLSQANILPLADFKKLDETTRFYYPGGFAKVLEIKKFQELKALETEKPDEAILTKIQEFSQNYSPGDIVPPDIRRWWGPMIRLEELQNTFRPDLLDQGYFKYRPTDLQKYQEVVERMKPRQEDIEYINTLVENNPDVLKDPSFARLKAIADKFGATTSDNISLPQAQTCSRDYHWVYVPFMPNSGYCVPNIVYAPIGIDDGSVLLPDCPPGYHRNEPRGACYPDNPYGPGGGPIGGKLPAPGSCGPGYHWIGDSSSKRGGYCAPDYPNDGGYYPRPITPPSYCPSGEMFRDGKCVKYNSPPPEGCPSGYYWNGNKCIQSKDCGAGYYQDHDGNCKQGGNTPNECAQRAASCNLPNTIWDSSSCTCKSTLDFPGYRCNKSSSECPSGYFLDTGSCSCLKTGSYGTPNINYQTPGTTMTKDQQEAACKSGGGTCSWSGDICNCQGYKYQTPSYTSPGGSCTPPSSGCSNGWWDSYTCSCKSTSGGGGSYQTPYTGGGSGSQNCGSGYYWNGSYCQQSSGSGTGSSYSYPTPYSGSGSYSYPSPYSGSSSGSYQTPYYGTPSGTYGTPTYGTPSYGSPTYETPQYGTPTYETPQYGTPTYETPPYGTPQ